MIQAVGQFGDPFSGGSRTPAGNPVGVGGSINSPGTQATPPGVPSSAIITARNNRGSNVRIPYARLVPMHGRTDKADIKRQITVDGKPALEYEGLRHAELAWILGRRFKVIASDTGSAGGADNSLQELANHQMYGHQAYSGVGFGVDRMQRLASTAWVEALFEQKLAGASINLHDIYLDSGYNTSMDDQANLFKDILYGSTAINCTDVTFALAVMAYRKSSNPATQARAKVGPTRLQGIFCRETGPFLRGFQVKPELVSIPSVKNVNNPLLGEDLSRQLGTEICFSALEIEMRRRNLMDWTPDGVVLSKLEDGDPTTTAQIDARMAQLFNVAISGPAISTTWTSDLRDAKMECQPMDKVFIVIVADLVCTFGQEDPGSITLTPDEQRGAAAHDEIKAIRKKTAELASQLARRQKNIDEDKSITAIDARIAVTKTEIDTARATLKSIQDAIYTNEDPQYITKLAAYNQTKKDYDDIMANVSSTPADKADATDKLKLATDDLEEELWGEWDDDDPANFAVFQARIRSGQVVVTTAKLMNFRLARMTSSYMNNYSKWTPNDRKSRLGLPAGGNYQTEGMASYIIGGWCIGTVLDSAASRSTVGQMVRTAPCSMALNINVNVEWWSADKLFQSYMDRDGLVTSRGQLQPPKIPSNLYKDAKFKPTYSGNIDSDGAAVNTDDSAYELVEIEAPVLGDNVQSAKVPGQKNKRQRRSSTGGGLEATLGDDGARKKGARREMRKRSKAVTDYEFGAYQSAWGVATAAASAGSQASASATSCSASSVPSEPPAPPRPRSAAPVGASPAAPAQGSGDERQAPVSGREPVNVRRSAKK